MNRVSWAPAAGRTAFLPSVQLRGFSQPTLGGAPPQLARSRYTLGLTAQEWYTRAKEALAQYELLLKKLDTIDNKTERDNIRAWLGKPEDENRATYRYNTVKQDSTYDVAREGVGAYNEDRRQGRVEKLEAFNKDFKDMVDQALKVHGVRLPGETRIETREVESSLTTPILIGAGVVTAGILIAALA